MTNPRTTPARRRFRPSVLILVGLATGLWLAAGGARPTATVAQGPNRAGPTFYADFSGTADTLLRNAASHVRDAQWAEAVDLYQRVIQQFGDKVARLPREEAAGEPSDETLLYVDIRQFCQRKLASLPPEARAIYRSRADALAERWFRQGEAERDRALLRRVIDQAFCSSFGDDAAELLGDLAFQDGRFEEALANYRRIVADRPDAPAGTVHPDPDVDRARVAAKKLLCRAAMGEDPPARADLDGFARAFPGAKGMLAGRDGPYLETLTEALQADHLAPPAQPDGRWPTFAGAATRTRVLPDPIDVGSIQWRVELEPIVAGRMGRGSRGVALASGSSTASQRLGYHPIVMGDQVIVADETRITAYNLNDRPEGAAGTPAGTVKVAWRHDEEQGNIPQAQRFSIGMPRYTLTAQGDRIYARMGLTSVPYMGRMGMGGSPSFLVALDRRTDGKLIWKKPALEVFSAARPVEGGSRNIGFEGTPVADARHVYVALTERREQTATYVACLDADTGAPRWVRYLGAAASDNDGGFGFGMGMGMGMGMGGVGGDSGHRLLSLDGPTIYYQTNLGAVAALDAETGSIRWVATYPRQERNGTSRDRDLNPAIVHDGMVIVAPDDAATILAYDSGTGRLLWKTDPIPDEVKLAHLLGVARGKLVATGDRVLLFDVKTGKLVRTWPDNGHGFEAFGRGLLAGDKIYWPTRNEIHVLDQVDGLRTDPPIKLQESFQTTGGNLAAGDGYLVVAQSDQLVVFCQNRRLIQRYREEIARTPDLAAPHYRLAQAAEATGQDELALRALEDARKRAKPSEVIDGEPLVDASRDQTYRILMKLGRQARTATDLTAAAERFRSAAEAARSDRDRLRARLVEAETRLERGEAARSVDTLQQLLSDAGLRSLAVASEDGRRSIRADLLIGDRLAAILARHGRGVYERYDREAASLLETGRASGDLRRIEEVGRSYPAARVAPESLIVLARLHASRKQPAEAARAYKRLLATADSDATRARALLGLARAYEAQKLWVPARDAYAQALARFPTVNVEVDDLATDAPLGPQVARRLEQPPFDRMVVDRAEPVIPAPLFKRWKRPLEDGYQILSAEGTPPSPDSSRILLTLGKTVRPVPGSGVGDGWSADLGGPAAWAGYLDDRLVAATATRIVALDVKSGATLWQFESGPPTPDRRGSDPFARGTPAPARGEAEAAGPFQGFRIVGGRVFVFRGDRELVALDGDSGQVEWTFRAAGGTINPRILIGPERTVLQTRQPHAIVALETATGRRLAEFPESRDQEEWARDPLPLDDERVALVPDRRTVAVFDLTKGVNLWVFRESREMPKNGPPRLLGDSERLLVVQDGTELIRLDASTGLKRWSRPLGIEDLSERPEAIALDGERVYWVSDRSLNALALRDGGLAWSRHLSGPESGWSIELTERWVMAYPGLPRQGSTEQEGLPLVFRRRDSGALVQRLLFDVPATDLAVRLAPGGALVATPRALWGLGGASQRPVDARAVDR